MDELLLKNSIRLLVSGFLYDGMENDICDVPDILREIAKDYDEEIKKFSDSLEGV